MFALVIFVCYLGGHCESLVAGTYINEPQCLSAMEEQQIRNGGCFPLDEFHHGYWRPAHEYRDRQ
ncbi:YebW family protein [Dickeya lacustris]|uniref:YebW family protein n=1 Tax=Dickeya lacustris TaxID=2259638 RepID=A0ABY8G8S5_9GAMM|nr:YebW family protein [Dickeya lacustris]WFN56358.1 YebW family protein [Dickeya lacustris]